MWMDILGNENADRLARTESDEILLVWLILHDLTDIVVGNALNKYLKISQIVSTLNSHLVSMTTNMTVGR